MPDLVGPDTNEERLYAPKVTLMRPSKLKLKVGNWGSFAPSENIYSQHNNLTKLKASITNYQDQHWNHPMTGPFDYDKFDTGDTITALGASSNFSYVLESDVDLVKNAKRTYLKMMEWIRRSATTTTEYYTEINNAGTQKKTASATTTITPGANGSILISGFGQAYELDFRITTSAVTYVYNLAGPKASVDTGTGGANDQWVHMWWGKMYLLLPFAGTMNVNGSSASCTFDMISYSGQVSYAGTGLLRVVDLPSWWDTDA